MKMTPYARETKVKVRASCVRAVELLEEQVRWASEAHALKMAELEARIRTCKETIDKTNEELAAVGR